MSAQLDETLSKYSLTAVVFFRGWWCPACREHLQQLDKALDDFADSCFGIIAVTSQPENDGPIAFRLSERQTDVRFSIVSDETEDIAARVLPLEAQFRLPTPEHLTTRVKVDGKPFTPYTGLQPAVAVVDSSGETWFVWSWDDLPIGALDVRAGAVPTKETMTRGAQGDPWMRPNPESLLRVMKEIKNSRWTPGTSDLQILDLYEMTNQAGDADKLLPTLVKVQSNL